MALAAALTVEADSAAFFAAFFIALALAAAARAAAASSSSSDSDSSSDSGDKKGTKGKKKDSSSSSSDSDEEDAPKMKMGSAASGAGLEAEANGHHNGGYDDGYGGTGAKAFKRVDVDKWMGKVGSQDNSYRAAFGDGGWGAGANQILSRVRGKDFRHEKTKKKRPHTTPEAEKRG